MLSIFCPYRDRDNLFYDFIQHYKRFYPESFIYMLEQDDDEPFKRGQLPNVIFNEIIMRGGDLENIAYIDIDLRLFYKIDFEKILNEKKTVVVPFDNIVLYEFIANGVYLLNNSLSYFLKGDKIAGGITLYTKQLFEVCNGFSNVYIGWGCEDSDFLLRQTKIHREKNDIIHLEHIRDKKNHSFISRNAKILTLKRTDPFFDGYRQTTVKEIKSFRIDNNVYHYKIKNIGVITDFKYKELF